MKELQSNRVGWVSAGDGQLPRKAVMKLIVVGDGGVGKTTLIHRFLTGTYLDQRMTVGSGFATKDLEVDGVIISLTIWDFAGEERFRFLMPRYCQGAHGCILAFDLTRPPTFYHLDDWLTLVRNNTHNIPILLVGTKLDVASYQKQAARYYAELNSLDGYLETSSKEGANVAETFEFLTQLMWNRVINAQPYSSESSAI